MAFRALEDAKPTGGFRPLDAAPEPDVSTGEAAARGAAQGATLGFSDEIGGAYKAASTSVGDWLYEKLHPDAGKTSSFAERYTKGRNEERAANARAEKAHPYAYGIPEAVGTVATDAALTAATGGAALPLLAAGQGAVQGAGYSDAPSRSALVHDTGSGAILGLGGFGAGAALSKAGKWLAQRAGAKAGAAAARAAQQGAEESSSAVASLEGAARERAANAYRQMERIQNALRDPALSPADRAAIEAFKKSPEYADLVAANAKGVLAAAPDALAEREAAAQVASQARADLPQAIANRTDEISKSSVGADLKSLAKSYGEPIAGAVIGGLVGDQLGSPKLGATLGTAGGLITGRTRMGKAIATRVNRPGNQLALWGAVERAANRVPDAMGRYMDLFRRAASPQSAEALAAVLMQRDPEFREIVTSQGQEESH